MNFNTYHHNLCSKLDDSTLSLTFNVQFSSPVNYEINLKLFSSSFLSVLVQKGYLITAVCGLETPDKIIKMQ